MPRRGSSPRMRGTPYGARAAFKSSVAHPHVCGEHIRGCHTLIGVPGSSPRMRGTQIFEGTGSPLLGLIPTYAGNTGFDSGLFGSGWAHPHVCGEHDPAGDEEPIVLGSSPRMRGTPTRRGFNHTNTGLIPTYAGNTPTRDLTPIPLWAHPHVCGEHTC